MARSMLSGASRLALGNILLSSASDSENLPSVINFAPSFEFATQSVLAALTFAGFSALAFALLAFLLLFSDIFLV